MDLQTTDDDINNLGPHILEPLEDAAGQIRLLRPVYNHRFGKKALAFELGVWSRDELPVYNAISYVWGDEFNDQTIVINGKRQSVRYNCRYALWQVTRHYPYDYVWIDSVCIKQDNLEEKTAQVRHMNKVYCRAGLVLSCVGPHADDSEKLFGLIGDTHVPSNIECSPRVWESIPLPHEMNPGQKWVDTRRLHRYWLPHAIRAFGSRIYWERLWIVPEISANKHAAILCGNSIVAWNIWLDPFAALRDHPQDDLPLDVVQEARVRPYCELEHIMRLGHLGCADCRDRFYAFTPSESWKLALPLGPDYTVSPFDLATRLMQYASTGQHSLLVILNMLQINAHHEDMCKRVKHLRQRPRPPGLLAATTTSIQSNSPGAPFMTTAVNILRHHSGRMLVDSEMRETDDLGRVQEMSSLLSRIQTSSSSSAEALRRSPPVWLYSGNNKVGIACNETRPGDLVMELPRFCMEYDLFSHGPQVMLVLRHDEGEHYSIVGQAVLVNEFAIDATVHGKPDPRNKSVSWELTGEELAVFAGQDMIDEKNWDPALRILRTITDVTASPHRAVRMWRHEPMKSRVDESIRQRTEPVSGNHKEFLQEFLRGGAQTVFDKYDGDDAVTGNKTSTGDSASHAKQSLRGPLRWMRAVRHGNLIPQVRRPKKTLVQKGSKS